MKINELNEQFGIKGKAQFENAQGGLSALKVNADGNEAEIYLHGAHVTHFAPAGEKPILWLSKRSWFEAGKPIRGGVPVCFPWFGMNSDIPDSPAHGPVRLNEWDVESLVEDDEGKIAVTLIVRSDDATRAIWPGDFELRHTITVGEKLTTTFQTTNTGQADIVITEAMHYYFAVSDVRNIAVSGLDNVAYHDFVGDVRVKRQGEKPITFTGETDRVYVDTSSTCKIDDPGMARVIRIEKVGSDSTVVWNPWATKAARTADFDDNEWPGMVCVEVANARENAVTIGAGQSHSMQATISLDVK